MSCTNICRRQVLNAASSIFSKPFDNAGLPFMAFL